MNAYAERDRIAREIAANAEHEATLGNEERLRLSRDRRNRLISAAWPVGTTISIEIGDEKADLTGTGTCEGENK